MQRLALVVAVLLVFPAAAAATVAAEPVAVCGHTTAQPTLQQGSTGTEVAEAQCELNLATKASKYTPIGADGSFGAATDARVRVFQRCAALSVDGQIGPNTWTALNSWAARPKKCATQGTADAAQSVVCGLSTARPTLQSGSTGTDVKELQCRLRTSPWSRGTTRR